MGHLENVKGETSALFERRVEAFFCYSFKPEDRWVLSRELLVVVHPDRAPIFVREGGKIEDFVPTFPPPLMAWIPFQVRT